ncbi:MAG: c-type cytochrome, partial [Balneolaceae bacterium]|nr:c-type cytochrome [Balneolaceae bacterium]
LVASEPAVRQPVDLHFDARGRLWVVQYLQYPFPAGATINFYDQYLRAEYNRELLPPPNHVPGADKITLLEDRDGDGTFETHRDVITGLDITTSVLFADGGLWVMNPPYLLFYPDHSGDGVPDGEPQVRLEGFGLEDTHSVANGLTYGPDGWIYGVHGSTSTSEVRGFAFLGQATWRYHPGKDEFELFSEGGGNPWTLDFDRKGRAFSGTNAGNTRGIHEVQGGRYVKNWPKHGPLTTPYSFGYFDHMDHRGYPQRFSMTFLVYEEGRLPGYEGQHISGMALTNRVQAARFLPDGSTFRTVDTDSLVTTTDRGFRPVDIKAGPDGGVYIADWCDIRMNHVQPVDTWNKSCGRIWRLQSEDYRPAGTFDLTELGNEELIGMLSDKRKWYRGQARRILGERGDRSILPRLREMLGSDNAQAALEALWTANLIDGIDREWASELIGHPDPHIRAWTVRLLGDARTISTPVRNRLVRLAATEPDAEVRSQLAASSRRLAPDDALPILRKLIGREEDLNDKHIPLLIWWVLEELVSRNPDAVLSFLEDERLWQQSIFRTHLSGRLAKRFAWERGDTPSYTRIDPYENWIEYAEYPSRRMPGGKGDYTDWETNYSPEVSEHNLTRLARLIEMAPDRSLIIQMLEEVEEGLAQGPPVRHVPDTLTAVIDRLWNEGRPSSSLIAVAARLGHPGARKRAAELSADANGAADRCRMRSLVTLKRGEQGYLANCASCHQADGGGMERMAASLRDSRRVGGDPENLIRILLHGLQGELMMPAMGTLPDQELAAILTYIRSRWGRGAEAVSPGLVKRIREETEERTDPWTPQELSDVAEE